MKRESLPTCSAAFAATLAAALSLAQSVDAQTIVKPEFLMIVDTSGSMRFATGSANSCGYTDRRANAAACAVRNIADGVGDAIFGMATYQVNCNTGRSPVYQTSGAADGWGCGVTNCRYAYPATTPAAAAFPAYPFNFYGCEDGGVLWVSPREANINLLRSWGDNSITSCTTAPGVGANGGPDLNWDTAWVPYNITRYTPLAGSLRTVARYLSNQIAGQTSPYRDFNGTGAVDTVHACRPMNVVLLTDGAECCDSNDDGDCDLSGTSMGAELNSRNIGCLQVDLNGDGDSADNPITTGPLTGHYEANIDNNRDGDCYDAGEQRAFRTRVYPIGFGLTCPDTQIEAIAQAGGLAAHATTTCGATTSVYGYYASTESEISAAMNQIVADSQLIERCNNLDDNCNGMTDEGFDKGASCTVGVGACQRTGTKACNVAGDGTNCSVTAGAPGTESSTAACSDGADNDCDGFTDCGDPNCAAQTFCNGSCTPTPEVCDGRDNDCDGQIDEGGITRSCGFALGRCTTGVETCQVQTTPTGVPNWANCTAVQPIAEICNNADDNCNGVTDDGITQACGSDTGECRAGVRLCMGGTFSGACIGEVTSATEVCDNLDNDCDGSTDEGLPAMGSCGASGVGVCTGGMVQCVAGMLQCVGGTMPGVETCNRLDDDCNGATDDNIPSAACTVPGTPSPVVGACRAGSTACRNGLVVCEGAVGPGTEVCNGADDDCDGETDEGVPTGLPCGATMGVCTVGSTACVGGREVCMGATMAGPEICDNMDNDCDGETDEGNPGGGGACGMATGECVEGVQICRNGMLVCEGGQGAVPEVCDGLDNDCDGTIDDDLTTGAPCGTMTGECEPGTSACVNGREVCMGSRGPSPEECNCKDDDCDGETDEGSQGLCGSGSVCAGAPHCGCLKPCLGGEFPCPVGRTCETVNGMDLCVGDPCATVSCNSTTEICLNGVCHSRCEGVTCDPGLVCNPRDGRCVTNDCRVLMNCTGAQICRNGSCMDNPCANVTCPEGQACYDGTCAATCANVTCPSGQMCERGACVAAGRCVGVTCPTGQVCDPSDGSCTMDLCRNRTCTVGQRCNGVTGLCENDPCAIVTCPSGQSCSNGQCVAPPTPPAPPRQRVIAQGGPFACAVSATSPTHSTTHGAWLFAGLGAALWLGRRKRNRVAGQEEVQG